MLTVHVNSIRLVTSKIIFCLILFQVPISSAVRYFINQTAGFILCIAKVLKYMYLKIQRTETTQRNSRCMTRGLYTGVGYRVFYNQVYIMCFIYAQKWTSLQIDFNATILSYSLIESET